MRMNIATYNIHRGVGRDGRYRPQRILQVLQELDADIIALQEVVGLDRNTAQLLPWLATEMKMTAVAGPVQSRPDGDYGNAFLTRLSVEQVRRWDISVGKHEPRGLLDIDLDWQGRSIQVLNTHLGLWPSERRRQVRRFLPFLDVQRRVLTILMGDLNEWCLWGESLRILRGLFGRPAAPLSFPSSWPLLALDRIWVSPETALVGIRAHRTALSGAASDHLPVRAEVQLVSRRHQAGKQLGLGNQSHISRVR